MISRPNIFFIVDGIDHRSSFVVADVQARAKIIITVHVGYGITIIIPAEFDRAAANDGIQSAQIGL